MDRTIVVRLTASVSQYQASLGAAAAQTRAFGQDIDKAAREGNYAMDRLGKGMAVAGGLLAAGLAISVSKAMEFEREMRNVNSITKQSEAQFATTSNQVLALSRTVPQSAATLAKGLYDIASSGFAGADGMKILESSAIAATAGMTTTDVSAKAITSTLNAYGLQASSAGDISDILFKTVEVGVLTFEELASGMGDWVGMAAASKVPVDEAAAAIAAMTLSGVSAAESGTSLNRVLQSIISPSEELANKLAELGYESGAQALETDGLRGVMEKLRGATGGNITELQALFPEVRALRGVLALTANEGRNFGLTFDAITDSQKRAGAAQAAYNEQSKALSVQWDLTKSSMNAFAIEVGNRLLPALSLAAQFVGALFDEFSGLSGPMITAITALAGVAAVALTVGGALLVLAPKIVATKAALLEMGPAGIAASNAIGKMFGVLQGAAVLVGFAVLLKEAAQGVQDLYTVRVDASKLIGDLEHLAATGEITGESLRVFGADLDGLAEGVENIANRGWSDQFLEALNVMDTGAEASRKRVGELDAAFAGMANSGNIDGAATAFDRVTERLLAQGLSIEEVRAAFPEYLAAHDNAKAKADALAGASDAEREVLANLSGQLGETTLKTDEQTEAQKLLQKVYDDVSGSIMGFTEPMDAYRAALAANTEAARAEGQAALDRAEDVEEGNQLSGKSWEDYAQVATVSLQQVLDELNKQEEAYNNWADNLATIAARGRGDLAIELAKLGPEAAPLVQSFADETGGIFNEAADAWIRNTQRGQDGSAEAIVQGALVQQEFARQGASATVETVAAALDLLPPEVQRIVEDSNQRLRDGEPAWNESWGNRTTLSLEEMQRVASEAPPKVQEATNTINQHLIDTNPAFAEQFASRRGVSIDEMNTMLRDAPPVVRAATDLVNQHMSDTKGRWDQEWIDRRVAAVRESETARNLAPPVVAEMARILNDALNENKPAWYSQFIERRNVAVNESNLMRGQVPPIVGSTGDAMVNELAGRLPPFRGTAGAYTEALSSGIRAVNLASYGATTRERIGLAEGGIVEFFAQGGMKESHQAQIARAGDWRVWAEPETGGEAYIPLAVAKRDRSTGILEEVASRFGLVVRPAKEDEILDYSRGGFAGDSHDGCQHFHSGGLYVPPAPPQFADYGPPIRPAGSGTMQSAYEGVKAAAEAHMQEPHHQAPPPSPGGGGGLVGGNALARVNSILGGYPGARVTSTYRSPSRNAAAGGATNSYHMDRNNPAVDIGGPTGTLDLVAGRLRSMGGWREGPLWRVRGHYDHVHVAEEGMVINSMQSFDKGGWLQPGMTLAHNGTGLPERVVTMGDGGLVGDTFYGDPGGYEKKQRRINDEEGAQFDYMNRRETRARRQQRLDEPYSAPREPKELKSVDKLTPVPTSQKWDNSIKVNLGGLKMDVRAEVGANVAGMQATMTQSLERMFAQFTRQLQTEIRTRG